MILVGIGLPRFQWQIQIDQRSSAQICGKIVLIRAIRG
jgi:hypothetical protein